MKLVALPLSLAMWLLLCLPNPLLAKEQDPLSDATRHMQEAHDLLKQSDATAKARAEQEQALVGLDALIVQLTEKKKKCQGGGKGKPSGESKPKPGKPGKSNEGSSAAKSAPPSTSGTPDRQIATATQQLIKDLWGHLPDRQQQQILQPLSEEFLPQYAEEIEAYFRALAEPVSPRQEAP